MFWKFDTFNQLKFAGTGNLLMDGEILYDKNKTGLIFDLYYG